MTVPPTGTITFLFSDIEGSTKKWEKHPDAMRVALAAHDRMLREIFEVSSGYVFKTIGDAFCVAFDTARNALAGALECQRALRAADWGELGELKVRMALHTGAAEQRDGDYFGQALNRVARILSSAHGGQVLVSLPTEELVRDHLPPGAQLRHLGEHRLRDLARPEHLYQLVAPNLPSEFGSLRSLESVANNLPVQLSNFIGREREMAEVKRLLGSTRLLTLTGMGGTGKTRLSLQVAADVLDTFPDGVWFVEFATIDDPSLVLETVAAALDLRQEADRPLTTTLTSFLRDRTLLLILDNCEHVVAACARLAETSGSIGLVSRTMGEVTICGPCMTSGRRASIGFSKQFLPQGGIRRRDLRHPVALDVAEVIGQHIEGAINVARRDRVAQGGVLVDGSQSVGRVAEVALPARLRGQKE